MSEDAAKPAVHELMTAAQGLAEQLAALPEDDLLAHMEEVARGLQGGAVRVILRLAEAVPGSPVGEYAVSVANTVAGLTAAILRRRAEVALAVAQAQAEAAAAAVVELPAPKPKPKRVRNPRAS